MQHGLRAKPFDRPTRMGTRPALESFQMLHRSHPRSKVDLIDGSRMRRQRSISPGSIPGKKKSAAIGIDLTLKVLAGSITPPAAILRAPNTSPWLFIIIEAGLNQYWNEGTANELAQVDVSKQTLGTTMSLAHLKTFKQITWRPGSNDPHHRPLEIETLQ
jgi:hypothetical protein